MTHPFPHVFHNVTESTNELNDDLILRKFQIRPTIGKYLLILTNLNKLKRLCFLKKTQKVNHPPAIFNNTSVVPGSCQKYLKGAYLDKKLNLTNHIKQKFQKQAKVQVSQGNYSVHPRN